MSDLWSRIFVAAVGLPLVVLALWAGGWWLFVVVAPVGVLSLHEYFVMTRPLRPVSLAGYAGLAGVLVAVQVSGLVWAAGALLGTLALAFLLKGLGATHGSATVAVATTMLGAAWIGLGLGCALMVRQWPDQGLAAALGVLLAVFAGDTAAFFVGRLIGRHKLAPTISPGKTWEGLVAGSAAAIFVVFVSLYEDREEFLSIAELLGLGAVVAVAGPLGDLFESMVKRDMGLKDSGRLLGGHGGMLDRLDAILFAFPAAFFTILAFTT